MAWLKYELSYAHGYGPPEYLELSVMFNEADAKAEVLAEHFDGIRTPRWTVLDRLPEEEIARRLNKARGDLRDATSALAKYSTMLAESGATPSRWWHQKSGGTYRRVCEPKLESTQERMVVYESEANLVLWVRPASEFYDGRFKEL